LLGVAVKLVGSGTNVTIATGNNLIFAGATATIGGTNSILTLGKTGDSIAFGAGITGTTTFSGDITMSSGMLTITGMKLTHPTGPYTTDIIKAYGSDTSGLGVYMQSGGAMIIGSGESPSAASSNLAATTEDMWVTSDNAMRFMTNMQSGYSSRKEMLFGGDGNLTLAGNLIAASPGYVAASYFRTQASGTTTVVYGGDGATSNANNFIDIRPWSTQLGLVIREDGAATKWANLQVDSVARPDKLFITYLVNGTSTANKGVDIDTNGNMGVSGNITTTGTITAGIFAETVGNDVAEVFKSDEPVEPGDVVIKNPHGDGFVKSTKAHSKLVVGVVSDTYGYLLGGAGIDRERKAPIGLCGRVDVKVTGDIEPGDLLVSSHIPGVAMAKAHMIPGTVIGKALEGHIGSKVDRISMLVMNA
jgi:hypothetical protein